MGLANKEKQTVSADIRALIFLLPCPVPGQDLCRWRAASRRFSPRAAGSCFLLTGIFWAVLHPAACIAKLILLGFIPSAIIFKVLDLGFLKLSAIRANLYSIEVAPVPSVEVQACVLLPEIQPWKLHTFLFIFVSSIVNNYLILL